MKSTKHGGTLYVGRTARMGAYVIPFVAVPTMLSSAVVGEPPSRVADVRLTAPRSSAVSLVGIAIDHEVAEIWQGLHNVKTVDSVAVEDLVLARMPKQVERRRMRVVERQRVLQLADTAAEIEALVVANGY